MVAAACTSSPHAERIPAGLEWVSWPVLIIFVSRCLGM